jgi:hypothetical protein
LQAGASRTGTQEKGPGRQPQACFARDSLKSSDLSATDSGAGRYAFLIESRDRVTWALIGSAVSAAILLVSALISLA